MSTIFKDPVEVGGLEFNTRWQDENGVLYYCDLLDGWDDTAAPTVVSGSFTFSDGVVLGNRFPLKEQYIEFGGWIRAGSELALELGKDQLRMRLAVDPNLRLIRGGPIPKAMSVRASGPVEFPQTVRSKAGDYVARFLVQVVAPWPFKESPTPTIQEAGTFAGAVYFRKYTNYKRTYANYRRTYQTAVPVIASTRPESITVINRGNTDAFPAIDVHGPLEAGEWVLVNETTNEQMSFDIDLSSASLLQTDMKDKTAIVNGQAVDYYIRGSWLKLVPGNNRLRLITSETSPNAYFRVMSYDTYR